MNFVKLSHNNVHKYTFNSLFSRRTSHTYITYYFTRGVEKLSFRILVQIYAKSVPNPTLFWNWLYNHICIKDITPWMNKFLFLSLSIFYGNYYASSFQRYIEMQCVETNRCARAAQFSPFSLFSLASMQHGPLSLSLFLSLFVCSRSTKRGHEGQIPLAANNPYVISLYRVYMWWKDSRSWSARERLARLHFLAYFFFFFSLFYVIELICDRLALGFKVSIKR